MNLRFSSKTLRLSFTVLLTLVFATAFLLPADGIAGQKPDKVEVCHISWSYDFGYGDVPIGHIIEISESAYQAHINHDDPEDWKDLILPDGSEVCLHEDLHEEYSTILKLRASSSFQGNIIKQIGYALAKGAISKIGGDGMGRILDILGWGIAGDSDEQTLGNMDAKLDDIIGILADIEGSLIEILLQLDITKHEIMLDIEDPFDDIRLITAAHSTLSMKSDTLDPGVKKEPGSVNKDDLLDFADQVLEIGSINEAVVGISLAIKPVSARTPVLKTYVDLLLDQILAGKGTIADAYLSLEFYVSQLVVHQLKGVNLMVEANNLHFDDDEAAQVYLASYKQILKEEIGITPDNTMSFMYNVYRLALETIDPQPTSSIIAFPNTTREFLKRALFYQHSALHGDQNEGLHVLLVQTQETDTIKSILYARNTETREVYPLKLVSTTRDVPGNIYDKWDVDAHLSPGHLYTVGHFSGADADMPVGKYEIGFTETLFYGIYGDVDSYNDDYTLASEGDDLDSTNNFGYATIFSSSPWDRARSHTYWTNATHLDRATFFDFSNGATADGGYNLPYVATVKAGDNEAPYSGWAQLRHYMRYDGISSRKVYVDFAADVSGFCKTASTPGFWASSEIYFSVYDATANKNVSGVVGLLSCNTMPNWSEFESYSGTLQGTATFIAEPGHLYFTYYNSYFEGWGFSHTYSSSTIRRLYYEAFRFE